MAAEVEYTIDELARAADTTVRSVRVYHERGLLPSPEVRGRVGYYRSDHLNRLETISRLLSRGMKLNGIKELLEAWDRGDGLAEVLGVSDATDAAVDGSNPDERQDPELPDYIKRALAASDDPFIAYSVANPRCADLAMRLDESGLSRDTVVQLIERLRSDCASAAERCADDVFQFLAVRQFAESRQSSEDRTRLEMALAIARMLASRAAAELIEQAFGRHSQRYIGQATDELASQP